ncbi:hypothetical protein CDAR_367751 [Caerostris darwini]|uniref:DUF5641 domain-containing protein n=1 Tax=Caerostris darwini TaxID=1538125 RepID=A0AAV4T2B2_9ARAC|nr:hypothetical protein CDAR_367751 [Caerostris darwini]
MGASELENSKIEFLGQTDIENETANDELPIALDGNLFKTSGRDFGKSDTMSICVPSSKERSGGSLKRFSKLETFIKESKFPPATWPLGRISEVHHGEDKYVHVGHSQNL